MHSFERLQRPDDNSYKNNMSIWGDIISVSRPAPSSLAAFSGPIFSRAAFGKYIKPTTLPPPGFLLHSRCFTPLHRFLRSYRRKRGYAALLKFWNVRSLRHGVISLVSLATSDH